MVGTGAGAPAGGPQQPSTAGTGTFGKGAHNDGVALATRAVVLLAIVLFANSLRMSRRVTPLTGPPLEKRNVFAVFSQWLKAGGGASQLAALMRGADAGGDGTLSMQEVKTLLAKVGWPATAKWLRLGGALMHISTFCTHQNLSAPCHCRRPCRACRT